MLASPRRARVHTTTAIALALIGCGGATATPSDADAGADEVAVDAGALDASSADAAPVTPPSDLLIEPGSGVAPIYAFVQSAKTSIDMTMYELTDSTMTSLLTTAAAAGITVRVILDQNLEKKDNTKAYDALSAGKVQVHWANNVFQATHQKTITIDGATSAVMTMNLTPEFYKSGREFVVFDSDDNDVAAIEQTFGEDFANSNLTPPTGDDLVWSPTNASSSLLGMIDDAKSTLVIENEEMGDSNVVTALSSAAQRGVAVEVIMTASSSWDMSFNALKTAGVKVVTYAANASLYIHAKVILADYGAPGARVFIGSENFSNASLTENRELGLILTDATILDAVNATLASDFAGATPY